MVFSANKFEPIKTTWFQRFSDQPHQLFFTSSIFFAWYCMLASLLSFFAFEVDFSLFHGFGLNFAVFSNAFMGFLLTVIPKYSGAKKIEKRSYLTIWIFYEIGVFITLCLNETLGKIVVILTLLYLVFVFYKNIKSGFSREKNDSYLLSFLMLFGSFLLFLEVVLQKNLSILIFYGYLLNVVFIVALKMIPNFYSMFTLKAKWQKSRYINEIAVFLIFMMGLCSQFQFVLLSKIIAIFSLIFFAYIIFKLDIYTKTPPILAILVFSMIMFFVGIIGYFLESIFEIYTLKLSFHIFALAFVLNLFIGFGSRVVMGHAVPAQKIDADRITIFLFIFSQFIWIFRVLGSAFYLNNMEIFMKMFYISSILWIILFFIWSFRYGKTLLRIK